MFNMFKNSKEKVEIFLVWFIINLFEIVYGIPFPPLIVWKPIKLKHVALTWTKWLVQYLL